MAGIWVVLQHVAWEGPGIIATEARARGLSVDVRRLDRGDAMPPVEAMAGLIVMGGPMGVHDTGPYPNLLAEQRLLRAAEKRRAHVERTGPMIIGRPFDVALAKSSPIWTSLRSDG